jgi:predicted transglutaminase-like cysteine proteinase
MLLRLWLLVLLVCVSAFAPSRADARAAENRTWVFLPTVTETRLETEPQVAGTHQENGLWNYEHAPGCTQAAETTAVKLTQSEASALSKINNILNKGLKPGPKGDIAGGVADMMGSPIPKPGGGYWDHAQDLGGMLSGDGLNPPRRVT